MHAHHRADFIHAIATSVDDDIAVNVALGVSPSSVVAVLLQTGDGRVADRPRHPRFAPGEPAPDTAARGQCPRPVDPKARHQIVRGNQRMPPRALRPHPEPQIRHPCPAPCSQSGGSRPSAPVCWQADAAVGVMIVDGIIRVVGKLFVEVDRVCLQAHHRLVHAKVCDLGRRVPRRAAGQLVALDKTTSVQPS